VGAKVQEGLGVGKTIEGPGLSPFPGTHEIGGEGAEPKKTI
jgi:hypothetical protein